MVISCRGGLRVRPGVVDSLAGGLKCACNWPFSPLSRETFNLPFSWIEGSLIATHTTGSVMLHVNSVNTFLPGLAILYLK